jgi:ABC-type glycerol-3-phosphate transport system substrate-binding protein
MIKRLLLILALGAALAACSPASSSTSPDVVTPTIETPASMAPSLEVSPSP